MQRSVPVHIRINNKKRKRENQKKTKNENKKVYKI